MIAYHNNYVIRDNEILINLDWSNMDFDLTPTEEALIENRLHAFMLKTFQLTVITILNNTHSPNVKVYSCFDVNHELEFEESINEFITNEVVSL